MDLRRAVKELGRDLMMTRKLARQNQLGFLSSAVAFFCVFSLCPFLILSALGTRILLGNMGIPDSPVELAAFFSAIMPTLDPGMVQALAGILQNNLVNNAFGLSLLLWSTYELFASIHTAFDRISNGGKARSAVGTSLVSILGIVIAAMASVSFLVLTRVDAVFLKNAFPRLASLSPGQIKYLTSFGALLCVVGGITLIYALMPTRRVTFRFALRGSLLFLTLFLCGRATYAIFSRYYRMINENVYGTFYSVIVVLAWIYFLCTIFLFAAQYTIQQQHKENPWK